MTTPLASASEMSKIDARAINEYAIPSDVLMETAGKSAANEIWKRYGKNSLPVTIICGKGNNGGDGYVVAKSLYDYGAEVSVLRIASSKNMSVDSLKFLNIILSMDINIEEVNFDSLDTLEEKINKSDLVVDAILGSGSKKRKDSIENGVTSILSRYKKNIVSLDVPSGVDSTTGEADDSHFVSSLTISFGVLKRAHVLLPASRLSNEIINIDIGIPQECINDQDIELSLIDTEDITNILNERPLESHKGANGNILIIGGSSGMIGAPIFSAMGAYRTGAGKVSICMPEQDIFPHTLPPEIICRMVKTSETGFFDVQSLDLILRFSEEVDVVVLGPGISTNPRTYELIQLLLRYIDVPMIIDADAINCIAQDLTILEGHKKSLIMTPHPGEMARLTGSTIKEIQNDRVGVSSLFATDNNLTLVLKGWGTIISNSTGKSWINNTGNPGMSVAGMGDVLAGMIGTFRAQKYSCLESCMASVFLHGIAGDLASESIGNIGIIPSDLVKHIPDARSNIS
ncbi:MAG: NAD(P)H-hydrate dehydratase [Nitrospinota bacterium]|nr:NAD(P)H-hydrate dehydratase [Nitrospinota bacterium]